MYVQSSSTNHFGIYVSTYAHMRVRTLCFLDFLDFFPLEEVHIELDDLKRRKL